MGVFMRCTGPLHQIRGHAVLSLAALLTGCSSAFDKSTGPDAATGPATSFGIWTPGPGECSSAVHDGYSVVGPDRQLYPTWHPPVDPATGCSFGHEHGRDPRGSALYQDVGDIPFGYANEALDIYDPGSPRHEDHVGHKIEWENAMEMQVNGEAASAGLRILCDVLTKLHQGTHSKDAFTNNLHELVYHIRCNDGTEMHLTFMAAIGTPGEFVPSCDHDAHVQVGPATPTTSPSGGGKRILPDRGCIEQHFLVPAGQSSNVNTALRESWQISQSIRAEGGHSIASINPYFQVLHPSRFYDASLPNGVGRPIDACYEVEPNGDYAQTSLCDNSTAGGTLLGVTFDDPQSEFDGVRRFVDVNSNRIDNADGPEVWYSDPFGKNARPDPFPGSIRQFIAKLNNEVVLGSGPAIGRERNYGSPTVHAPN